MAEQDELWIKESKDGKIRIGLSPRGQEELGDISFANFLVDDRLTEEEPFVSFEAAKAVTDILAPISGQITRRNDGGIGNPEDFNSSSEDKNWLLEVIPDEKK